jgi:beta-lactamase class A
MPPTVSPPMQAPETVMTTNDSAQELDGLSQLGRSIWLKYQLQKNIKQNEDQQILTSVTVQDMQSHHYVTQHNNSNEHFAASVNKVPITMLVLEELRAGHKTLDTVLTWQESDRRAGAGVYDQDGSALQAPLRDVLFDLLNRSGNTAARILVNGVLGGAAAVNTRLSQDHGLQHTYLIPLDANRFYMGYTTSQESLKVMEKTLANQDQYGQFVKNALVTTIHTDRGAKAVPVSDYIVVAAKAGWLDDPDGNNRHDTGLIYNTRTNKVYGYSFLTTAPNSSQTATLRGEQSLIDMARATLKYAGNKAKQQPVSQPMTLSAPQQAEGRILY